MTTVCWALLLFLIQPGDQPDAEPLAGGADWNIERFQSTAPIGTNHTIEIDNSYGDIRTRAGGVDEIGVSAMIQSAEGDPYEANIGIDERDGRVVIEVGYVFSEGGAGMPETDEMKRRRVDVTVIFPAAARLEARTTEGLIEAKGLEADVRADSRSGDIAIHTAASVQARTERGEIRIVFKSGKWAAPPTLETLTGDISVWLPADADAAIEAETEGFVTTDYSLEIERADDSRLKRVRVEIGRAAHPFRIATTKGRVSLFRADW